MNEPTPHPLAELGTAVLWRSILPGLLGAGPPMAITGLSGQPMPVFALPEVSFPSGREILEQVDEAMRRAGWALEQARQWVGMVTTQQLAALRNELWTSYAALRHAFTATLREGATAAGDVIYILAQRIASAIAVIGEGLGHSWRAFWGFPPWAMPLLAYIFAAALIGFGGYALLQPGMQKFILGGLKETAPVLKGFGGLLGGGGVALARLGTTVL